MKSKAVPLTILVAMVVSAVLRMSGVSFFGGSTDPRSKEFLAEVAAGLSGNAPVTVDADTEFIGAHALEGVLVYDYRLVNLSAHQVVAVELHDSMRPGLTSGACADPQTRERFLDQGIALRYAYADKHLRPVMHVDVTAADCGRSTVGAPEPGRREE